MLTLSPRSNGVQISRYPQWHEEEEPHTSMLCRWSGKSYRVIPLESKWLARWGCSPVFRRWPPSCHNATSGEMFPAMAVCMDATRDEKELWRVSMVQNVSERVWLVHWTVLILCSWNYFVVCLSLSLNMMPYQVYSIKFCILIHNGKNCSSFISATAL